jgi:hypothetical protein
VILKLNAVRQSLVYRTSLSDLGEAFALRVIEVAFNMHIAGDVLDQALFRLIAIDTIVGMYSRKLVAGADKFEGQPFVLTVQRYRFITSPLMAAVRNMNDCSGAELGADPRHASWYRRDVNDDLIGVKATI